MKKIIIVIGSNEHLRNYFETNAFSNLNKNFKCIFAFPEYMKNDVFKYGLDNIHYFSFSIRNNYTSFLNLLTWKYRKKSKAFFFRHLRLKLGFSGPNGFANIFNNHIMFIAWHGFTNNCKLCSGCIINGNCFS